MSLLARLSRLEDRAGAPTKAVEACSFDLQWAIQSPLLDEPAEERLSRIIDAHGLDEADLRRALILALTRKGVPRDEAVAIAALGVLAVLQIAAKLAADGVDRDNASLEEVRNA